MAQETGNHRDHARDPLGKFSGMADDRRMGMEAPAVRDPYQEAEDRRKMDEQIRLRGLALGLAIQSAPLIHRGPIDAAHLTKDAEEIIAWLTKAS